MKTLLIIVAIVSVFLASVGVDGKECKLGDKKHVVCCVQVPYGLPICR